VTDGRTYWWAKDAGWWRTPNVVDLAAEFGPGGALTLDWLCCETRLQDNRGHLRSTYARVARACFLPGAQLAERIVQRLADFREITRLVEDGTTFSCRVAVPRIPGEHRRAIPRAVRLNVLARHDHACVACGAEQDLQLDHIVPWSAGGEDTEENLQVLCASCNRTKGATL
jgi:hypothetical protein